jgi:hypothetical protein
MKVTKSGIFGNHLLGLAVDPNSKGHVESNQAIKVHLAAAH